MRMDYVIRIAAPGDLYFSGQSDEDDGEPNQSPPATRDVRLAARYMSFNEARAEVRATAKRFPLKQFRVDTAIPLHEGGAA